MSAVRPVSSVTSMSSFMAFPLILGSHEVLCQDAISSLQLTFVSSNASCQSYYVLHAVHVDMTCQLGVVCSRGAQWLSTICNNAVHCMSWHWSQLHDCNGFGRV